MLCACGVCVLLRLCVRFNICVYVVCDMLCHVVWSAVGDCFVCSCVLFKVCFVCDVLCGVDMGC